MILSIPYLRIPCFVTEDGVRFASGSRQALEGAELEVVRRIFEGGYSLDDIAEFLAEELGETSAASVAERLRTNWSQSDSIIGLVDVEIPTEIDMVLVEQGYGGVYVHSVELFKKLQKRWTCVLLSPEPPLFESDPLPGVISLTMLQEQVPSLDYLAFAQIMRTVVKKSNCRLLLLMHRSQSFVLFDLLQEQRSVIYCDGFYDRAYKRVGDFQLTETPERRRRILSEIYYLIANTDPSFKAIPASPAVNAYLLMAGGYSLNDAVENWCWGQDQLRQFSEGWPELEESLKLMLPFTNPEIFQPEKVERERRVLFTTTMHNIDKKGLPELVRAMAKLPSVRTRCVVRQPQHLPKIPKGVARRMEMGPVTKPEMVELYHRMWVNCRTSREESSPMSILESMTCELPQIVSPAVSSQIPIIEDGVTGFVVNPDDTERLVWAIRTILGDAALRDRMGRECRRRAERLSYENRVGEFERLLA